MAETASPRPDALLRSLLLEKCEAIAVIGMSIRFPGDNNTPRGVLCISWGGVLGNRPRTLGNSVGFSGCLCGQDEPPCVTEGNVRSFPTSCQPFVRVFVRCIKIYGTGRRDGGSQVRLSNTAGRIPCIAPRAVHFSAVRTVTHFGHRAGRWAAVATLYRKAAAMTAIPNETPPGHRGPAARRSTVRPRQPGPC